jgi:hypothetical protein
LGDALRIIVGYLCEILERSITKTPPLPWRMRGSFGDDRIIYLLAIMSLKDSDLMK